MVRLRWAQHLPWCLLAWVGGVALQLQQSALWPAEGYALLALLALWLTWLGGRKRFAGAVCAGLAALAWSLTGGHALMRSAAIAPELEGRDLDVVGVVQAMPQRQDTGWRFRFRIEQARLDRQALALPEQLPSEVYLGWYAASMRDEAAQAQAQPEAVQAGERWRLRVRLKAAHGQRNPRGFDQELWLWEQGIRATGYVRQGRNDPPPERLAQTLAHPLEWARQLVRDRILSRASASTGDGRQAAGILAALVTGDQAAIDRSDWDVFRATGVSHLMSISGVHVTMLAWLAAALASGLWRRSALWGRDWPLRWPAPQVGAVVGLGVAVLYALFSGWGVPAQRTVCMLAVVALLRLSARDWHWLVVWGVAAAVVVTLDPWAMLQPGFWLSFVAVGVLMATDRPAPQPLAQSAVASERTVMASERTDKVPNGWGGLGTWPQAILVRAGALLREQLLVTLALTPLTVLFFGQVSLVGLLANLVAIPWITMVVTPLAMLGVLMPLLWDLAQACLQPLSWLLVWLASWPGASWSRPMPPWPLAVLALAGTTAVLLRGPWSWRIWGLPWLLPALLWVTPRPPPGHFELLAADVGQGTAVLVRTAQHSLLYDAGPRYSPESDAGHRVLVPLLAQTGESLDVLMLSHRDSDHTGGAAAVLAMQPRARLWSSLEAEHPLLRERPHQRCEAGQHWTWDGVTFEVLHPVAGDFERPRKSNALSCVLRIRGTTGAALLAGDIEAAQERELLARGLDAVDFWLVPHHGSKTSSTPELLQVLQPHWALAQAGYRNRFGHPAAPVVSRYREAGIAWTDSAHCGAATWRSDAPRVLRCERTENQRYWHHRPPP